MPKPFRERLEEYLIGLETELGVPKSCRNYVMKIFDKTEHYGKRELSDEDFEKIKVIARERYATLLETKESLEKTRTAYKKVVRDLVTIAEEIEKNISELEKKLDDFKAAKKINAIGSRDKN